MAKAKTRTEPTVFSWSGLDKANRKASGEIEAQNLQSARMLLRRQGVRVKKIRKQAKPLFSFGNTVKVKDVVFLTRQLATMIEAGIPIAQSLRGIALGHDNTGVKNLLGSIRSDVEAGTNLSSALRKHPQHFNRLYTSLVTVGEQSGTLDILMNKIASYLEKIEEIKSKVRSALFYPALVIIVAVVIVAILLIVVIPEFEILFQDFGADLPSLTRWVVDMSHSVQQYWVIYLLATMVITTALVFAYKRSTKMQYLLDKTHPQDADIRTHYPKSHHCPRRPHTGDHVWGGHPAGGRAGDGRHGRRQRSLSRRHAHGSSRGLHRPHPGKLHGGNRAVSRHGPADGFHG